MGILLQLIGIITIIAGIVTGILAIMGKMEIGVCLVCLIVSRVLIKIGRKKG